MFAMILGYTVPDWALFIAPVLGTVMYAWGGWPFLTGAVSELRSRKPGMMLLIGLAITVAFFASWGATLGLLHHELEFWWELALLIVIMLLGHWIEMRSLAQTSSALDTAALLPDEAERVEGDQIVKVSPADLQVGDVVVVRPGGSVPADGKIVDGRADMDESMVTGESRPVARGTGDPVTAGTVATDSGLRVEVTATGMRPPSRVFSGWSRRHRTRPLGRSGSPTRRRRCCSGSRWAPPRSPRWCGLSSAIPMRRSCAPSPCWSSPARTRWAWRSRWWCPSPLSAPPVAGCW
jgi:hypothetical protein